MPRGNRPSSDLRDRILRAREILDEALELLSSDDSPSKTARKSGRPKPSAVSSPVKLDFSMPLRAFVKAHCKDMSGPKKFTLLVAYLACGDASKQVPRADVEKSWNKLTGLLGTSFNPAHTSRARENDWVNTAKAGSYHLRPRWREILR